MAMIDPDTIPPERWKQMNITPEEFKKVLATMDAREKNAPAVGNLAPNFELKCLSTQGELTDERVQLSALRGRPVAIVFGSYT